MVTVVDIMYRKPMLLEMINDLVNVNIRGVLRLECLSMPVTFNAVNLILIVSVVVF